MLDRCTLEASDWWRFFGKEVLVFVFLRLFLFRWVLASAGRAVVGGLLPLLRFVLPATASGVVLSSAVFVSSMFASSSSVGLTTPFSSESVV
jgi:hypothetical protein